MRAADLMTNDVFTLPVTATVADAVSLIAENEVRHIPLVDADGRLSAVLSDRDVRRIDGLLAVDVGDAEAAEHVLAAPITGLVGGPPLSIDTTTEVDDIIDVFLAERVGALVVTDPDQRVVGIVSVLDVLAAAKGRLG
ncbi:MAG: HPP family protein [Sandaracinaceae bacterium]